MASESANVGRTSLVQHGSKSIGDDIAFTLFCGEAGGQFAVESLCT